MPLNNTGMQVAANALRGVLLFAQLHSGLAGGAYTSNLCSSARVSIPWAATSGLGNFGLSAPINFTGGAANGTIFSLTMWSASSAGTCYGEFLIGSGDLQFNSSGDYSITASDWTGILEGS